MPVSKEMYLEWKDSVVTREIKQYMLDAVNSAAAAILNRRDSNPLDDQYLKGFIRGLSEALEAEPEIIKEEEDNARA